MSKGIVNNRDKFVWDNAHKPTIDDAVAAVDDELDDMLEDHDDKVVDIVGDNMDDLLTAHDDKVVDIVGDNMSTLLTSAASTVRLLAGDRSGITSDEAVKVGVWDDNYDIYALRFTYENLATIESGNYATLSITQTNAGVIACEGMTLASGSYYPLDTFFSTGTFVNFVYSTSTTINYRYGSNFVGGTTTGIVYFLVATT